MCSITTPARCDNNVSNQSRSHPNHDHKRPTNSHRQPDNVNHSISDRAVRSTLPWRAPTDNDDGSGCAAELTTWRDAAANRRIESVTVTHTEDGRVRVDVLCALPSTEPVAARQVFTIAPDG